MIDDLLLPAAVVISTNRTTAVSKAPAGRPESWASPSGHHVSSTGGRHLGPPALNHARVGIDPGQCPVRPDQRQQLQHHRRRPTTQIDHLGTWNHAHQPPQVIIDKA